MQYQDTRSQSPVITFRDGLLGFADARNFALLRTEDPGLFWLQSQDHEALAFLLLDPFIFFDDYTVVLDPSDASALGAEGPDEVAVLAIVTLPSSHDEPYTANLVGPVAINLGEGLGRQIIIRETEYGVRAVVDIERKRSAS